jgi:hypothetical protein
MQPAGVSPATTKVTIHRAGRLRLAQHCELQKTIFEKRLQTTANEQRFLTLPRHYAASGLLNLHKPR